tara:strand:+ start:11161 stop:12543 length:1383 start_codon:yes stop_codon:yes gene_type:complete
MSVQIRGRQIMDNTITAAKLVLSDNFSFAGSVSVPDPTADGHAANKGYVDGLIQGLHPKEAVRVLSKSNVDISSAPATIDGVTMGEKDRVCLTNQSTATENGIYKYSSSGSAMSRTGDADTFKKLQSAYFFVKEGTSADEGFVQTAELTSFAGQTYVQFSSAGNIVAGNGLAKSGNTLSVNVDGSSLEISSDSLQVKAGGITNTMLAGSIENSKLSNSAISIAGSSISLGGTITAASILGAGSTSNLPEGSNLYYTDARAQAAITVSDSSEVDLSISSGEISAVLKDGSIANARLANSAIEIAGASTALGGSISAASILGASNTDSLGEGSSNLYFTNARAQAAITVADSSEVDLSYSGGQISAALKADSVALSKVSYQGYYESFTANGSSAGFDLARAIKANLAQSFVVTVNGLVMDYKASPDAKDNFKIDNTGAGSVGKISFGANLDNGDKVAIRYVA